MPRRWVYHRRPGPTLITSLVTTSRDLLRTAGRASLHVPSGNIYEAGYDRRSDSHEARTVPEAGPGNPPHVTRWEDSCPALEVLQHYDRCTRVQILASDRLCRILRLSQEDELNRKLFLAAYRTGKYLRHLSEGRFDEITEAANNQEYDGYFSDLRHRLSTASTSVATALRMRSDPQPRTSMALTVPPVYEPSDLPPYTATIAPPEYSPAVANGQVTRDAPPCLAAGCPVAKLGIEHSCGQYNHNGQVGPVTTSQGGWLSFGPSNPPPTVWNCYNRMVLGVASQLQTEIVKSFVRYHGPNARSSRPLPSLLQSAHIPEYIEQLLPHGTNQGRMGRIPSPATRNEDPKRSENLDVEGYMNLMHHLTHLQASPRRNHRFPQAQSMLGPEPWDPQRLPLTSGVARYPLINTADENGHLQLDQVAGRQRSRYHSSTRRIEPDTASLVPEPLRIPHRRASILSSNNLHFAGHSRASEPSHHRAPEEQRPARRVSARPALADVARSPNTLLEVPPRPDGHPPIANMYPQTSQSHRPERRRHRHSTSTVPTNPGVHLRRQPFYGHVYSLNRQSTRQPLADGTSPAAACSRAPVAVRPATRTASAVTRPHTPYPSLPPDHPGTVGLQANHGAGILGTFEWERNAENCDNAQLLATLAAERGSHAEEGAAVAAEEEVRDSDIMTYEAVYERYAPRAHASDYLV